VRSQVWEGEQGLTFQKVVRDARFRWIVFRTVKVNISRAWCSKDFSQCVRPVVAEVIGEDLDSRRKIRGYRALASVLKFGDSFHKSTRNVEWRHAHVDVEHDLTKGGASGGVESLEGEKHLTEAILAILFRREKVAILPGSDCRSRGALLDDEVKGRDKRLEVPLPLAQVCIAISVQNSIDLTIREGGGDRSPGKLLGVQLMPKGDFDLIGFRSSGRRSLIGMVDFNFQGLLQLAR